jgi:hypothetical protein
VTAGVHLDVDAGGTHVLYGLQVFLSDLGDELKRHPRRQAVEAVRKIERGASRHVNALFGGDDIIAGDMPDTAYIFHEKSFRVQNYDKMLKQQKN